MDCFAIIHPQTPSARDGAFHAFLKREFGLPRLDKVKSRNDEIL
ncbi:hypothetical protein [Campylobacter troglodytis]|nr:hypothetical protein [Campylobacter troglodytis]